MKTNIYDLTRNQLNWAVAKAQGIRDIYVAPDGHVQVGGAENYDPVKNWNQGGPIIESGELLVWASLDKSDPERRFQAKTHDKVRVYSGRTILEAAMRCFAASHLSPTGTEISLSGYGPVARGFRI